MQRVSMTLYNILQLRVITNSKIKQKGVFEIMTLFACLIAYS